MLAHLEKALNVRPRELLPASLLFTYLFLVIGAYIIGQSAGDALFLSAFPTYLPHAIIATAVAVGILVSIHIRLSRRLPLEPLSIGLLLFFAASFALLWWATGLHNRWVYALNFVWVYAAGAMAPIVGWTLANYVLTTREARRVFGFIGAGAILGGTCAGLFTAAASRWLGPENLILVMAFLLAAAALMVKMLFMAAGARIDEAQGPPSEAASPHSFRESWRLIHESRYLLLITALIAIGSATTTIIGYQFKIIAKDYFVSKEALTAFFGRFYGCMGLAAFFLQILLTGRLLRSFGIRITLFVLPVVFLAGGLGVLLVPVLATAIVLKGSHSLLRYSLDKSSAELLYLPVASDIKNGVKSFIDGFVWRTADGVAGLVLLQFATLLHFGPGRMSLVTLVFAGIWIAVAAGVRGEYLNVLRGAIQQRGDEKAAADPLDSATSEMLAIALDRGDEQQVLYGLSLYEQAREPRWHPLLRGLLPHPSALVRSRVVRLLTEAGDREVLPQVHNLLRDRSPEVRVEALHYLVLQTECDPVSLIRSGSDFPDYALAGVVIAYLARLGRPEHFAGAQLILEQLLTESGPRGAAVRAEAARILGVIPPPSRLHNELLRLLRDSDPEVVTQALTTAGRLGLRDCLPLVVERLGQPAFAAAARAALAQYGDRAIGTLHDYLNDEAVPLAVRWQIPDTLAQIPTSQAAGVLALSLVQSDPGLRFEVVKALNKLRRAQAWAITPGGDFNAVLHAEITGFYRSFQILAAIDPDAGRSLDAGEGACVLTRALGERMDHEMERIFRMLALVYSPRDIYNAFIGLKSSHPQVQANALEVLEHLLEPGLYRRLVYALDSEITLEQKLAFAGQLCRTRIHSRSEALRALLYGEDRWLRACALHGVGQWGELDLYDNVRQMAQDGDELLHETWLRVMARLDSVAVVLGGRMLSVLEKVERLQKVPMFQGVRTQSLARVAALAHEVAHRVNDVLYREDDAPDCMYVLLDGEVTMTRGNAEMDRLGPNDVAGVLGLLSGEAQPDTARVTKPARLLKLDQQDFYDTMADDFQVTRGIMRALVEVINSQAQRELAVALRAA